MKMIRSHSLDSGLSACRVPGHSPGCGSLHRPHAHRRFFLLPGQAPDGNYLQGYAWAVAGTPARAVLVVVHGLEDHAQRCGTLARALDAPSLPVYLNGHSFGALVADPLIQKGTLPARTVAALLTGVEVIQAQFAQVRQPLLVLDGGADPVTSPAGSRALHEKATHADKTPRLYEAAYHGFRNFNPATTAAQAARCLHAPQRTGRPGSVPHAAGVPAPADAHAAAPADARVHPRHPS